MKRIESFDDALIYVNRLGIVSVAKAPGWLPIAQERLCKVTGALERSANGYPYFVRYSRADRSFFVDSWRNLQATVRLTDIA